jgi:hypothetical protein
MMQEVMCVGNVADDCCPTACVKSLTSTDPLPTCMSTVNGVNQQLTLSFKGVWSTADVSCG